MISRRSLLLAAPALLCAPAIVRAASLMAVRPPRFWANDVFNDVIANVLPIDTPFGEAVIIGGDFNTANLIWAAHERFSNGWESTRDAFRILDADYDAPNCIVRDSFA